MKLRDIFTGLLIFVLVMAITLFWISTGFIMSLDGGGVIYETEIVFQEELIPERIEFIERTFEGTVAPFTFHLSHDKWYLIQVLSNNIHEHDYEYASHETGLTYEKMIRFDDPGYVELWQYDPGHPSPNIHFTRLISLRISD